MSSTLRSVAGEGRVSWSPDKPQPGFTHHGVPSYQHKNAMQTNYKKKLRNRKIKKFFTKGRIAGFLLASFGLVALWVLGEWLLIVFLAMFPIVLWIVVITDIKQTWKQSLLPFSTIRGASQGPVNLKGSLVGETLIAPFSGKRCKAWRVEILHGFRTKNRSPKVVDSQSSNHRYVLLDDGTGTCVVPYGEDNWELAHKFVKEVFTNGEIESFPEAGNKLLIKQMFKGRELSGRYRFIVKEYRIDEDDTVYAAGVFKTTRANQTPYDNSHLARIKRKGEAASWFSKWVIREVGDGLQFDIDVQRSNWRKFVDEQLSNNAIKRTSDLPVTQTINTLVETTVDVVDGEATQQYHRLSATNIDPLVMRRKVMLRHFAGVALAVLLTAGLVYFVDPVLLVRFFQALKG